MLQIAIWGIAAMLVVKALDILHQQSISLASGNAGSKGLSTLAAVFAILVAIGLVYITDQQVKSTQATENPFQSTMNFSVPDERSNNLLPGLSQQQTQKSSGDAMKEAKDAMKAADDAMKAADEAAKAAADAARKM